MSIRIQTGGEKCSGTLTINCSTKHPSLEQAIVTRNLVVDLTDMPVSKLGDICRGAMTVRLQNEKIRKSEVNVARGWTSKKVSWQDIYSGGTRVVQMTDAEIKDKAKQDSDYRARLIAELEAMDE